MTEPRVFTVEEVRDLIPRLSDLVSSQMALQADIERFVGDLARMKGTIPESFSDEPGDSEAVATLKREIRIQVRKYERGWNRVEDLGAVVKDPRTGLLDFYGRVDGRLVWLCWRYGETSLDYYHDLDAGFAGRRPLEGETLKRLLN